MEKTLHLDQFKGMTLTEQKSLTEKQVFVTQQELLSYLEHRYLPDKLDAIAKELGLDDIEQDEELQM